MPHGPSYGQVDLDYLARLATTPPDEDGPVWMVNLMHYRERADYGDGSDRGLTGREADDRYAPLDVLAAIGAEVVFVADVERQLLGDSPRWDRIGVVKYPTRRAFVEMQSRPDFQEKHVHKEAGMAQTIVMGCRPLPVPLAAVAEGRGAGGAQVPWDEVPWDDVPHPPTAEDGPVVVLHVIRFEDETGATGTPAHMQRYQAVAGRVARAHGLRISGWFGVEGTVIGDGRAWHQVRFNAFPSLRAFMAVASDPDRRRAQAEHRETAMADTYTMVLRPMIDGLATSVAAAAAGG